MNKKTKIKIIIIFLNTHKIPPFLKKTIIYYKCTNYRDKNSERGIFWNDPKLKIKWPIKKPILSIKDRKNLNFKKFIKNW